MSQETHLYRVEFDVKADGVTRGRAQMERELGAIERKAQATQKVVAGVGRPGVDRPRIGDMFSGGSGKLTWDESSKSWITQKVFGGRVNPIAPPIVKPPVIAGGGVSGFSGIGSMAGGAGAVGAGVGIAAVALAAAAVHATKAMIAFGENAMDQAEKIHGVVNPIKELGKTIAWANADVGVGISEAVSGIVAPFKLAIESEMGPNGMFGQLGKQIGKDIRDIFAGTGFGDDPKAVVRGFVTVIGGASATIKDFALGVERVMAPLAKMGEIVYRVSSKLPPWLVPLPMQAANAFRGNMDEYQGGGLGLQGKKGDAAMSSLIQKSIDASKPPTVNPHQYASPIGPQKPDSLESLRSSPAVQYLRETAENTRKIADEVRASIIGGGFASNAAFNAVNIAGWSGGGSLGHNRAARLMMEAFSEMQSAGILQVARTRTLSPTGH